MSVGGLNTLTVRCIGAGRKKMHKHLSALCEERTILVELGVIRVRPAATRRVCGKGVSLSPCVARVGPCCTSCGALWTG